jgi:hypothetical protein
MRSWLWLSLALAACGGNPIAGSWYDVARTELLTFRSDGGYAEKSSSTDPTTQCTTVDDSESGGNWSTLGNMVTITCMRPTYSVTGCSDSTMNVSAEPDPVLQFCAHNGIWQFSVSGNQLTLTDAKGHASAYTKQ